MIRVSRFRLQSRTLSLDVTRTPPPASELASSPPLRGQAKSSERIFFRPPDG